MESDTRVFAARVGNLPAVTSYVEACADRHGVPSQARFRLLLALEEAFVNVCSYAYPGESGDAEITCRTDGDAFVLEIADHGRPFDILSLAEPDTTADMMHRRVGGLGVHFIRTVSSSVSYRREDDRNVLRMTFGQ